MVKLLVLFLGIFVLLGCSPGTAEQEQTIDMREKEQEMLAKIQEDYFIDSATFDEDSKTYTIVSDYHVKAIAIVERGEALETRNGQTISWEHYLEHYINCYFNGGESGTTCSYEISSFLGEGYTVKEVTSDGDIVFIAKDGELIYDIINGYAN